MTGQLHDKVVIISGAGSVGPGWGNGRAEAAIFAREGAKLFLVDRDKDQEHETRSTANISGATHILLPTALQVRRADSTEVIGNALAHKANGLGFWSIAERMGRPQSTVRRWLPRTTAEHVQWLHRRGTERGWSSSPARRSAPSSTSGTRSGTRCASCRRPRSRIVAASGSLIRRGT